MLSVEISGVKYDTFKSVSVTKSINVVCSEFYLVMTSKNISNYPIKVQSEIVIRLDDTTILTGYIDKLDVDYADGRHEISAYGRSRTSVLVDSSVINRSFNTPISLVNLFKNVISGIGSDLKVVNKSGVNPVFSENVVAQVGESCFSFLDRFCKKAQVMMSTDENGDVLLLRGDTTFTGKILQHEIGKDTNNVLTSGTSFDNSQRYRNYIVYTQAVEDEESSNENQATQKGLAFDTYMREGRSLVIVSETDTTLETVKQRAFWEANIRRARSLIYKCTVQGFKDNTGALYNINKQINVLDDFVDIRGLMLVNSVTFTLSNSGSFTQLELLPPDAYSLKASRDKLEQLDNDLGDGLSD